MDFIIRAFAGTIIEIFLKHFFSFMQEWLDDAAREQLGAERVANQSAAEAKETKAEVDEEIRRGTSIDEAIADLAGGKF